MQGEYGDDFAKYLSRVRNKSRHGTSESQDVKKAPVSKPHTQEVEKTPVVKKKPVVEYIDGFPKWLTQISEKEDLPIPAVPFHEAAPSLKKIFNNDVNIYVTPDWFFTTRFREVFQKTKLPLDQSPGEDGADEVRHWLATPDMKYWPQQLNFATWCATTGCGISRDIFDEEHTSLELPPQVRAFFVFHVYFTVRRILYQLGGPQNIFALPGDPAFTQRNNPYDVASYGRICHEFGIEVTNDFRFTPGSGTFHNWPGGPHYKRHPTSVAYNQYDWFCANHAEGLTPAGLSRINQSIEAFVYCVLGAQVDQRSSIQGTGGRAREVQSQFLHLFEGAVIQPDLSASVQRYQLAIDEAKVRLNLALCPGAWLMPGYMVINTESVMGYNNFLKQAVAGMKLGINNQINKDKKKVTHQPMDGEKSKYNPPSSHPSNPIHKAATAESKKDLEPSAKTPAATAESKKDLEPSAKTPATGVRGSPRAQTVETASTDSEAHDTNKTALIVGVVALAGLVFLASR